VYAARPILLVMLFLLVLHTIIKPQQQETLPQTNGAAPGAGSTKRALEEIGPIRARSVCLESSNQSSRYSDSMEIDHIKARKEFHYSPIIMRSEHYY